MCSKPFPLPQSNISWSLGLISLLVLLVVRHTVSRIHPSSLGTKRKLSLVVLVIQPSFSSRLRHAHPSWSRLIPHHHPCALPWSPSSLSKMQSDYTLPLLKIYALPANALESSSFGPVSAPSQLLMAGTGADLSLYPLDQRRLSEWNGGEMGVKQQGGGVRWEQHLQGSWGLTAPSLPFPLCPRGSLQWLLQLRGSPTSASFPDHRICTSTACTLWST